MRSSGQEQAKRWCHRAGRMGILTWAMIAAAVAVVTLGMSSTAVAQDTNSGDMRVANYSVGFENNNFLYRGYVFQVARETVATHMFGGGGPNCPVFAGGIYEASWNGEPGESSFNIDSLLRGVYFDTSRDTGSPPMEEQVEFDEPLTLDPESYYFIGQGRVESGSGCHYAATSIDVENLLIGSAILDEWYPNQDAAYQPGGTGHPNHLEGATTSNTTPIRVLVGFTYETDVDAAEFDPALGTGDALSTGPSTAIVEGLLNDSGASDEDDETTVYFEVSQQSDFTGTTTSLLPASPFTITGPATDVPFSRELEGLINGVTYYYRAVAINEFGRSNAGTREFTHDGDNPAPQVDASVSGPAGSVTPESVAVAEGEQATFQVSFPSEFLLSEQVVTDCSTDGASWSGQSYTTGPITESCSVEFFVNEPGSFDVIAGMTAHDDEDGSGSVTPGDGLTFQALISHEGGGAIDDLNIDNSLGFSPAVDECSGTTLNAGENCEVRWHYEVRRADAQAGLAHFEVEVTSDSSELEHSDAIEVEVETPINVYGESLTNDPMPMVYGSAAQPEAAIVAIEVYGSGGEAISEELMIDADGDFEWTLTEALSDGTYMVQATIGNDEGQAFSEIFFGVIDTAEPMLSVVSPQSVTNESQPLVSGFSDPGAVVTIVVNGVEHEVVAGSNGQWQWPVDEALSDGVYSWHLSAVSEAGNSAEGTIDFEVITATPEGEVVEPVEGWVTNQPEIDFSGSADAGTEVELFVNGQSMTTMSVGSDGQWSYSSQALPEGSHQAYVVVSDDVGNVGQSAWRAFEIDMTDPAVEVTAPEDGDITDEARPAIEGFASGGVEVDIWLNDDLVATEDVGTNHQWSHSLDDDLAEGLHDLEVVARDEAGNEDAQTLSFEVDMTPPYVSITEPTQDLVTTDAPEMIAGEAEAGAQVEISLEGEALATLIADEDGEWSLELESGLSLGTYAIEVKATDAAGNSSLAMSGFSYVDTVVVTSPTSQDTVRTATPTVEGRGEPGDVVDVYVDGELRGSAEVGADGRWSWSADEALSDGDREITVEGSGDSTDTAVITVDTFTTDLVIGSPEEGDLLNTPSPTISGSTAPETEVIIEIDGQVHGTVMSDANGQWTWSAEDLSDGDRFAMAHGTDEAGSSQSESVGFEIDTVPPHLSVTSPYVDEHIREGDELIIGGHSEPGATIEVFIDGQSQGTTTVDEDGSWSMIAPAEMEEGERELRVTSTDEAGNRSVRELDFGYGDIFGLEVSGGSGCSSTGGGGATLVMVLAMLGLLALGRRRWRRALGGATVAAGALMVLALSLPLTAAADQGFDAQNFNPMPNLSQNFFSTSSATVSPHGEVSGFAALNFASDPLVIRDGDGEAVESLVSSMATTHLLFNIGLYDRFEMGVDIPLVVYQSGNQMPGSTLNSEGASFGIGDLRLVPKVNLLNTRDHAGDRGYALALLVDTHLPTGNEEHFQGGDLRVGPRVAFDAVVVDDLKLGANLGYLVRRGEAFQNLNINDVLGWNVGAEYRLNESFRLTGELFGKVTPSGDELLGKEAPVEVMAGGKYEFNTLFVTVGAGAGLSDGYGAASWRGFTGFGFSPGGLNRRLEETSVMEPSCRDCEALVAEARAEEEERYQRALAENKPDRECEADADCRDLPEPSCEDGEVTSYDGFCADGQCLRESRVTRCGDHEICGSDDAGDAACVDAPSVEIDEESSQIELRKAVHFETASARIDAESYDVLDEVVQVLEDNPQIQKIRIEGHTDDRGDRQFNVDLSQERAESVMAYLNDQGIEVGRMSAVGLGPDEPIADNDTEEGRSENRRVLIHITEIAE